MRELISRFVAKPKTTVEIVTATGFISILALSSPIYSMQVLNRYVAYGVDATLYTLTAGVLLAVLLEFAFRSARNKLVYFVNSLPNQENYRVSFESLLAARYPDIENLPAEHRREVFSGLGAIEQAYSATNICIILDAPFALLFVAALAILSTKIALVVSGFLLIAALAGILLQADLQRKAAELTSVSVKANSLLSVGIREPETIRAFVANKRLSDQWISNLATTGRVREVVDARQTFLQSFNQALSAVLNVVVLVIASVLTVRGELDVGAILGANILAARALQPITRLALLAPSFAKARNARQLINDFNKIPKELISGTVIEPYQGRVEFRDVAFCHANVNTPIFESLSLEIAQGKVVLITGGNGTGKTTLARLILGLYQPSRGSVLVDGTDLRQVAQHWWRKKIIYLPQEPALLNASIEENMIVNCPQIERNDLDNLIAEVGLGRFLDESLHGAQSDVIDGGLRLPEGIRRRIALVRALATNGQIVIFDEPTTGLDKSGIEAVGNILKRLVRQRKTIFLFTNDLTLIRGDHIRIDLDSKPCPHILSDEIRIRKGS